MNNTDPLVITGESTVRSRECRAVFCPEESGGFSVYARNLPGVVSEGETLDEAIQNVKEAFLGAIETYERNKMSIPWRPADSEEAIPSDAFERWILVNA